MFIPFARSGWDTLWLYADDELITDRWLTVHSTSDMFADSWKVRPNFRCITGTVDVRRREPVDFSALTPIVMMARRREGDLVHESGVFTSAQTARFREVVEEGIWHWRDCSVMLPDLNGKTHAIIINEPRIAEADRLVHYAGASTVSMIVARREDVVIEMFGEPTAAAEAPQVAGRFRFDIQLGQMTDVTSGQSLSLETTTSGGPDAENAHSACFRYRDADGDCGIFVTRDARTQSHLGASWSVDFAATQKISDFDPPRSQRIHSFTLEALLLWPDTKTFGPAATGVLACGGWINGQWQGQLRRRTRAYVQLSTAPQPVVASPAQELPTSKWQFVAGPKQTRNRQGTPALPEVRIDEEGDSTVEPIDLRALSAARLSDRGHYIREDGGALLYLFGWRSVLRGPDGEPTMLPVYQYCDEDIRLRLHEHFDSQLILSHVYEPRIVTSAARSDADPTSTLIGRATPYSEPTELLWRRLTAATESRLASTHRGKLVTTGGYVAGVFDRSLKTELWFEPAPKKAARSR